VCAPWCTVAHKSTCNRYAGFCKAKEHSTSYIQIKVAEQPDCVWSQVSISYESIVSKIFMASYHYHHFYFEYFEAMLVSSDNNTWLQSSNDNNSDSYTFY
jgi:hypothetical protein